MNCPICQQDSSVTQDTGNPRIQKINCSRCGSFAFDERTADKVVKHSSMRWKMSAWILENKPKLVDDDGVDLMLESRVPSVEQRAERMLREFIQICPPGESYFDSYGANFIASGWNKDANEVSFMLENVLLAELGLIKQFGDSRYQISAKGLMYLEGRRESISSIGFCAMWFNEEVLPLWKQVIEPAVYAAGYDPLRIDAKEHNDKIDDQIMASIRASKFVVADITGERGGVYYEAGFAHGLGLPVIFMCREDTELHFDVRQYNCIFWSPDKLQEARERLTNRILATLGQGPREMQ